MAESKTKAGAAKKTVAKKTVAKKAAPKSTVTVTSNRVTGRNPAAKRTVSKKATSSKGFGGGLKAGDVVMVTVDPRENNGSSEAPATVLRVLNVEGENRVNLSVHLDSDHPMNLRNVPVLNKAPKADDGDAPTVFATRR